MKTAFPNLRNPVQITLYSNIPFDNTYSNHSIISRLFKDDGDNIYSASDDTYGLPKERFINRKDLYGSNYYPQYIMSGEFNFNYVNGLVTSVTLELTPAQTNANYMKVKCGNDIYYFFINSINQINYETYVLSLELDVLMTYQDEFLAGIRYTPVSTKRKHCHRFNREGYPHCADFKNNEESFAGVKPSIVKHNDSALGFEFKGNMKKLQGIDWLYFCYETDTPNDVSFSNLFGTTLPFCMMCIPMTQLRFVPSGTGEASLELTPSYISQLISDGKVHGCKISPYPPFNDPDIQVTQNGAWTEIRSVHLTGSHISTTTQSWTYNTDFSYLTLTQRPDQSDSNKIYRHAWHISRQSFSTYEYEPINIIDNYHHYNLNSYTNRILDPKLLFSPFRKYVLSAQYSEGSEIYPELLFADYVVDGDLVIFETSATSYIGDNNLITYIKPITDNNNNIAYDYYRELNIGLSSSLNYSIPAGTNALDVFNSTQAQSYYQSKIASGITSGLTIAGGVGTTIAGVALTATGGGAGIGAGLIAGGLSATAGGIASAVNNAKSVNAKIEDLRNTPDSVNVVGSNYVSDKARVGVNMPYLIVYECSNSIKESANEFFYNYGYAVSRDCYFNTELTYLGDDALDNNLFGRDIFNYVQTNEDITNKINADIPLIVKQKISKVFQQGITLWTFFRNPTLWKTTSVTSTNNPDRWFMQHELENAEFDW